MDGDITPAQPTNGAPPPTAPAWYSGAESLKTSDPEVWGSFEKGLQSGAVKDLPTLIKNHVNLEKRLGSALNPPSANALPAEVKAFEEKLGGMGFKRAPQLPESPDKYQVKLDAIPEAMRSPEIVKTVSEWAHRHGVTQAGLDELIGIEAARFEGVVKPLLEYNQEETNKAFADFAATLGKEPDVLMAAGGGWLAKNVSDEQMAVLQRAGLDKHPEILKLVVKAALDTGEDISILPQGETMSVEATEAHKAANDIIMNPDNPKHKLYHGGDKAVQLEVENMFKRAFPGVLEL